MPDLTTLNIQDLVLVLGSGAGGHTTLGWVTGVYLSTVAVHPKLFLFHIVKMIDNI